MDSLLEQLYLAMRERQLATEIYLHIASASTRGKLQVPLYAEAAARNLNADHMEAKFLMLDRVLFDQGIHSIVRAADHDASYLKVKLKGA